MKQADEEEPGTLDIPVPFEEFPPHRQNRIRRYPGPRSRCNRREL
jgi:hypothetical protein